jgi:ATP-dependent DNA helicase DinG
VKHAPLPSPVELGFPAKFTSFYPEQVEAIDRCVFNDKRFTALAMPTGAGKSPVGVATALLHPDVRRAIYLTSTKGLQDQLAQDFETVGLYDLRGARNYPCDALDVRNGRQPGCDEGPCHSGVQCDMAPDRKNPGIRPDCQYYGRVFDARRRSLISTNFAMYFAGEEYAEGLGKFDLLIIDEAHEADKELEAFLTLEITGDDTHAIGSKFLSSARLEDWRDWATYHKLNLAMKVESFAAFPPSTPEGQREARKLKTVLGKLTRLSTILPIDWIADIDGKVAKFAPMKVAAYAEKHLFRGIPHVVLMSATLTRKTTQLLGIAPEALSFWECPSRFPLSHRPVISINTTPTVRVDARMSDDTKYMWMRRIDRLIQPRRDIGWKGIIHTVSYQRMKELLASSDHRDIMITHDTAGTREAIRIFKASTGPAILVSPSIVTGYDFPDDECRYQIIGKVPLPDMRGAIMQARNEFDKEYSGYLAMQKLVQACGRPVRNPWDWAETFIVDDHFLWFLKKYRKHAPRWFLDAIEYVESFPEPLTL